MIFEAAPYEMNAVGEQRRGKRIPGMAGELPAVKVEGQRSIAIDAAAGWQSTGLLAHDLRLVFFFAAGGFSPIL